MEMNLERGGMSPQPSMSMEDRLAKRLADMEAKQKQEQPRELEKEHTEVVELQNDFSNEVTEQTLRHDPLNKLRGDKFYVRGEERERALDKYLGSLRVVHETGKLFSGLDGIRTVDPELSTILERVMDDKNMDEVAAAMYVGAKWRDDAIGAFYDVLARESDPETMKALERKLKTLENTQVDWKAPPGFSQLAPRSSERLAA